ncbi:MAG: archease [Candidatus Omnitrophota bacterium]
MKRYEQFEHTADIGVKIYGKDIKGLFQNAAFAMFDIIADLEGLKTTITLSFDLKAANREELLQTWLDELLFNFYTKWIIFSDFKIERISNGRIKAKAFGRHVGENKNRLKTEIKAITYHNLKIERSENGFEATVLFDT